jgi:hypothetical protein
MGNRITSIPPRIQQASPAVHAFSITKKGLLWSYITEGKESKM